MTQRGTSNSPSDSELLQELGQEQTWLCVLQYVINGATLYGMTLMWPAKTPAEAAQQAARLELGPGAQYHRIVVAPLLECESFRWLGLGQVESERSP